MNPVKISFAAMMVVAALPVSAGSNTASLHMKDLQVLKADSMLTVNFSIDPQAYKIKSHNLVTLRPALCGDNDTLRLDPVTIAGKSAWMTEVRESGHRPDLYRAGKEGSIKYSRSVARKPWMDNCSVVILADTVSECKCEQGSPASIPVAEISKPHRMQRFDAVYNYGTFAEEEVKTFELSGKANIVFVVNRTNIDWAYANNRAELDSILYSIRQVKENPDAKVQTITLTGYASPEGPYSRNVTLAYGRTEVVKDYVIKNSGFPASVFRTNSVPEDWQGLRTWLVDNPSFNNSERIISFIDSDYPIERRNDRLKQLFPVEYKYLLDYVYPGLRHTDYVIRYEVKKYETVEELRNAYASRPANLSESEFIRLASSYPQGSPEYDEVLITCAHIYPHNVTANLNAANAAMNRGQYTGARSYLHNVPAGPEKDYAEGVLAALEGHYDKALPLLERAERAGIRGASENLRKVREMMAPPAPEVTIL